jgi:hypothetical protein
VGGTAGELGGAARCRVKATRRRCGRATALVVGGAAGDGAVGKEKAAKQEGLFFSSKKLLSG